MSQTVNGITTEVSRNVVPPYQLLNPKFATLPLLRRQGNRVQA